MAKSKPQVAPADAPPQTKPPQQRAPSQPARSLLAEPHVAAFRLRAGTHLDMEARVEVSTIGLLAITGLVTGILLSVVPIIKAAKSR